MCPWVYPGDKLNLLAQFRRSGAQWCFQKGCVEAEAQSSSTKPSLLT